jgi:hypothetical protein
MPVEEKAEPPVLPEVAAEPPVVPQEVVTPVPRRPLVPGPGLAAKRVATPEVVESAPEVLVDSETDIDDARKWFEPAASAERSAGAHEKTPEVVAEPAADKQVPDKEAVVEPAAEKQVPDKEVVAEPAADKEVPDKEVEEELVSAAPSNGSKERRVVVDLGDFEDRGEGAKPKPEPIAPDGGKEPALVGAAPEKSGIFNAVRTAFVRGKESHEHQFVEAPGGIGLTRHICSECGYISIGSSD